MSYVFPKFYHQDLNNITALFIMTVFHGFLFWKKEDCYHGNQVTAVLMPCYNTEETVLVYDPLNLDYVFALSK